MDEQENRKVIVVNPDGKTGTIPYGQLDAALEKQYRLATKEEADTYKARKKTNIASKFKKRYFWKKIV